MPRQAKIWVVMADSGHARIVTRRADAPGYDIVYELDSPDAHHLTRDLVSDRPGRVQESAYSGHHAVEPHTDPHEAEKTKFIRTVATYLNESGAKGEFD